MKLLSFVLMLFLVMSGSNLYAKEYALGPENSNITSSIKYAAIGRYTAEFEKFSGVVDYDPESKIIKSVFLKVEASSIDSNCKKCDQIVKSVRLLDVKKYPYVIFKSDGISRVEDAYLVSGVLELHGIKREMNFIFNMNSSKDSKGQKILKANGQWNIPRKEFDVIWSEIFDKGGVLVGNHINVDWNVNILE